MYKLASLLVALIVGVFAVASEYKRLNGFVLQDPLVSVDAIVSGGPPRDGIPSIDAPNFVAAAAADFLSDEERVIGVFHAGIAKAYPIRILNRHEIVNDRYGHDSVVVTYCPLCGSGIVFNGNVAGRQISFGVSGLLYNSDVLLYDRQTESLWSQLMLQAVSGAMKGTLLEHIPSHNTTWLDWRSRYPDSLVLSTDTGFMFVDYDHDPYAGYKNNGALWFPVTSRDRRLPNKEWVLGVEVGNTAKAYPLNRLRHRESSLNDEIDGVPVRIEFSADAGTAAAYDRDGDALKSVQLYWFAWAAFHPDTALYGSDR